MEKNLPVDVQIYIQKVREYLLNNEEAYQYFIGITPEDEFFKLLENIAIINYHKNQEPQLTKVQFEVLRLTMTTYEAINNEETSELEDSIYEYFSKEIKIKLK